MAESVMLTGLDEVMDWPAVWNPESPSHERLWGMIGATLAARGVVEGHAAGMTGIGEISAFCRRPASPPTMRCSPPTRPGTS